MHNTNVKLSRRTVVVTGTAAAAAALLPAAALATPPLAMPAVAAPVVETAPVAAAALGRHMIRVARCQRLFDLAAAHYCATGDSSHLEDLQWSMRWRLGFAIQSVARHDGDRRAHTYAYNLMRRAVREFPELKGTEGLRESLASCTRWLDEEGAFIETVGSDAGAELQGTRFAGYLDCITAENFAEWVRRF